MKKDIVDVYRNIQSRLNPPTLPIIESVQTDFAMKDRFHWYFKYYWLPKWEPLCVEHQIHPLLFQYYMELTLLDPDVLIRMRDEGIGNQYDFSSILTKAGVIHTKAYPTKLSFAEYEKKANLVWCKTEIMDRYVRDCFVVGKDFSRGVHREREQALLENPANTQFIKEHYANFKGRISETYNSLVKNYCTERGIPDPLIPEKQIEKKEKRQRRTLVTVQSTHSSGWGSRYSFSQIPKNPWTWVLIGVTYLFFSRFFRLPRKKTTQNDPFKNVTELCQQLRLPDSGRFET
uniref:Uncharacterized protein n=1 Tax=Rhipiliopsis peltata TaxID=2320810 RepID=A0A386B1A4_9CHLO|nr:hypothetical protein [Rhipiliopsis peltata]AYC65468.1 hypothetical protein [Rhipiliopsis peltata]